MNTEQQLIRNTMLRNPAATLYANGDAAGPQWTRLEPCSTRAVWHCFGCGLRMTQPVETHVYGVPQCERCNCSFSMECVEVKNEHLQNQRKKQVG
jgi:hypothetical protein